MRPSAHPLEPSVFADRPARPSHLRSCRQGAIFLKRTLIQLGAEASLLSGAAGKNPLVLATFKGKETPGATKKRVLFYGQSRVTCIFPREVC